MRLRFVRKKSPTKIEDQAPATEQEELDDIKRFETRMDLSSPDSKAFRAVNGKDDLVEDYLDVTIKGYLSTFQETTPSDRQGDYVIPGAFKETLKKFRENPVLLRDHRNTTDSLSGSFTVIKEDKRGLYVEAMLSNAPDVKSIRFKVAEGHLRSLSMGGLFHYESDGRGIFKVDLFEGSLTPVPANPDALTSTRSLTSDEKKAIKVGKILPCLRTFQ